MKRQYTVHHYMWFVALALAVVLALGKASFWYAPIGLYFVAEILTVLVLATFKGKVKQLPKLVKKAAKMAAKR